jgi:hypothetical protein
MSATVFGDLIKRARAVPLEHEIERRGIKLRGRIEREGPCPVCAGVDRFSINTKKGVWNCRGCRKGGDVIALVQFIDGSSFGEALETLALGERRTSVGKPRGIAECQQGADDYERCQRDKARRLWRASQAPTRTPVEFYLRHERGITRPLPSTLYFLPPLKPDHHPAMLVPYGLPQEPEPGLPEIAGDSISAVQLTLLKPDGSGKAEVSPNKITIGSPAGMPMVLAPPNDLMGLAITEGVEDALTAHQTTGLGAWASGGWPFMPKLAAVVPDYIETVTIYAHADENGQRGARELADALVRRTEVRVEGIKQ